MNLKKPPKWFVDDLACIIMDAVSCANFATARQLAKDGVEKWAEKEKKDRSRTRSCGFAPKPPKSEDFRCKRGTLGSCWF